MTTVDPLRTSFQVLVLSLSVDLLSVYPSVKWSFWFCLALFLPFLFFPEDFGGRNQPICPLGYPTFQICLTAPGGDVELVPVAPRLPLN